MGAKGISGAQVAAPFLVGTLVAGADWVPGLLCLPRGKAERRCVCHMGESVWPWALGGQPGCGSVVLRPFLWSYLWQRCRPQARPLSAQLWKPLE